jgi:hypothetical protein
MSIQAMEAELAGAKRSLAGAEASAKADKAGWGAELEGLRFEVCMVFRVCSTCSMTGAIMSLE